MAGFVHIRIRQMSSTPGPDEVVARIIKALSHFPLLKRELDWYWREEPQVYLLMLGELREAVKSDGAD